MKHPGYHGGFQHPVRSFLIGTTLLVLLFFGFVAGIELGSPPTGVATTTRLVQRAGKTVTVPRTITHTVISSHIRTKVINGKQYVVIPRPGGRKLVLRYITIRGGDGKTETGIATPGGTVTVYVPTTLTTTSTVTNVSTVTETETETETVTAPAPSDSQGPPSS